MQTTRRHKLSSTAAFTLFEVGVAAAVGFIAVLGMVQAVSIGAEMLDVGQKQAAAMQILRNEIDSVHLKDWTFVNTQLLPHSGDSITINNSGTGIISQGSATSQAYFALTNYSSSYSPPHPGGTPPASYYDDNVGLMSQAKNVTLSMTVTADSTRSNTFVTITYTVTWVGGKQRKLYTRSGTTYYWQNGLNVYYRR